MSNPIFSRTQLLLGSEAMERLMRCRVILFGVGGVGSWCAESLVRTGITHLTIVDCDTVNLTNINRQLPATTSTVGEAKVEVLRRRLLDINPQADIVALRQIYTADTADAFRLETYDYVIDAIDSLQHKADLILHATSLGVALFSSMGAALKLDPSRIGVTEFWKVRGCRLAAALRRRFKRMGAYPQRRFQCVYSDELLPNLGTNDSADDSGESDSNKSESNESSESSMLPQKSQVNGTVAHITAIFGFTLASLVVRDVISQH